MSTMVKDLNILERSVQALKKEGVQVSATNDYLEQGCAPVKLSFTNAAYVRAFYWRVTKNGKAGISSFDHQQKYGLPTPIDAISELQKELNGESVTDARLERETGDLFFQFTRDLKLQVFNFTAYEVWEIWLPDGVAEYSNRAK